MDYKQEREGKLKKGLREGSMCAGLFVSIIAHNCVHVCLCLCITITAKIKGLFYSCVVTSASYFESLLCMTDYIAVM